MKFAIRSVFLAGFAVFLTGCHNHTQCATAGMQWFPPTKNYRTSPVNCVELKRQQLYNMTNMNTETNNTTTAQRQELDDYIAAHCK